MKAKIAFITGASRGIGYAIAEKFAKKGWHLAINSRDKSLIEDVANRLKKKYHITCLPLAGDIADFEFNKRAFKIIKSELGDLELLINNAGCSYIGVLSEMSLLEWQQVIDTNLTSVFFCCKHAIPQMLRKGSGKIINISSVWGSVGASCEVAYCASKGGINALTKALAKELAPSNIQVNAVACGIIKTKMNEVFNEQEQKSLMEEIPTGRFGTTKEVADFVAALATAPPYLTGQIITLDGGWI
jgi:3-oxoacyl-[acyl-carrier protein] reductase